MEYTRTNDNLWQLTAILGEVSGRSLGEPRALGTLRAESLLRRVKAALVGRLVLAPLPCMLAHTLNARATETGKTYAALQRPAVD